MSWLIVFAVVLGVGYGSRIAAVPAVLIEYFGLQNVGTVLGVFFTASGLSALLGPLLAGLAVDLTGSYSGGIIFALATGLLGFIAIASLGAILGRRGRPPGRNSSASNSIDGRGGVDPRAQRQDHRRVDLRAAGQSRPTGDFRGGYARDYRGLGADRERGRLDRGYLLRRLRRLRPDIGERDRQDRRAAGYSSAARFSAALASFAFAGIADGFWMALVLRFLSGVALAGVHMPGLKLLADRVAGRARSARHRDLHLVLCTRHRRLVPARRHRRYCFRLARELHRKRDCAAAGDRGNRAVARRLASPRRPRPSTWIFGRYCAIAR